MNPSILIAAFLSFANKLKFRKLFFIIISLFIINLLIPDFIPFIDEIILGLMAIILANLKEERKQEGHLIEGEVMDDEVQKK
ncbi:MAG: DUF6116 family protein [Gammaproteobacteria bacterium]|jgi:hypothetical protein